MAKPSRITITNGGPHEINVMIVDPFSNRSHGFDDVVIEVNDEQDFEVHQGQGLIINEIAPAPTDPVESTEDFHTDALDDGGDGQY